MGGSFDCELRFFARKDIQISVELRAESLFPLLLFMGVEVVVGLFVVVLLYFCPLLEGGVKGGLHLLELLEALTDINGFKEVQCA